MDMEIWRLGADAARAGLSLLDCPYYRAANMPGHTGEPIRLWRAKVRAWEAGWHAVVDALDNDRAGPPPTPTEGGNDKD